MAINKPNAPNAPVITTNRPPDVNGTRAVKMELSLMRIGISPCAVRATMAYCRHISQKDNFAVKKTHTVNGPNCACQPSKKNSTDVYRLTAVLGVQLTRPPNGSDGSSSE